MKIFLTADTVQAYLKFTSADLSAPPTTQSIADFLAQSKVSHGLKNQDWKKYFLDFKIDPASHKPFLVAEGTPPQPGEKGSVEFMFDTSLHAQPTENHDGSIAYAGLNILRPIKEGDPVVRLHAGRPGIDGISVSGEVIPAPALQGVKFPKTVNTRQSPADDNLLLAAIDGTIRLSAGDEIIIDPVLEVQGDVNEQSGDVESKGAVHITGNVMPGFSVRAGGDIVVDGDVEDACLESTGSIVIKKAFSGSGESKVEAKGYVSIGSIENQIVKSGQSIFIAGDAILSDLKATKSVELKDSNSRIIGGSVAAGTCISAKYIGNRNAVPTVVSIGLNNEQMQGLNKAKLEKRNAVLNLSRVKNGMEKLNEFRQENGCYPPGKDGLLASLQEANVSLSRQITEFSKRIDEMAQEIGADCTSPGLYVAGEISPGVCIHYLDKIIPVQRPIRRTNITLENLDSIQRLANRPQHHAGALP